MKFTPEIIRTAIAAFGLVLTVGGSGMGVYVGIKQDIAELKVTVATLSASFNDLKCEVHPSFRCREDLAAK